MRPWQWIFFALLFSGCGPRDRDVGIAITLIAPWGFLLSSFAIRTLTQPLKNQTLNNGEGSYVKRLAQSLSPKTRLVLCVHFLLAGSLLFFAKEQALALTPIALVCYASAHLLISLVAWRIWVLKASKSAALGAPLVATALLLSPAVALSFKLSLLPVRLWMEFLMVAGVGWFVPLVLWLGLFSDVQIRPKVKKRRLKRLRSGHHSGGEISLSGAFESSSSASSSSTVSSNCGP